MNQRVIFVSDPLCSWCWAMAPQLRDTMSALEGRVEFDLLLGGINVGGGEPVGDRGRRRFAELWPRVTETTGQTFSQRLPEGAFVYNSMRACVAIHAIRRITGEPPFEYLHELQARFFLEAEDITQPGSLADAAERLGIDRARFLDELANAALTDVAIAEFAESKRYGTHALPSVLVDSASGRRLFAGGWVSAAQLTHDLESWLARSS